MVLDAGSGSTTVIRRQANIWRCAICLITWFLIQAVCGARAEASGCHVAERPQIHFRAFDATARETELVAGASHGNMRTMASRPCPLESPTQQGGEGWAPLTGAQAADFVKLPDAAPPRGGWLRVSDSPLEPSSHHAALERPPRQD
jgi:hypothetical protein